MCASITGNSAAAVNKGNSSAAFIRQLTITRGFDHRFGNFIKGSLISPRDDSTVVDPVNLAGDFPIGLQIKHPHPGVVVIMEAFGLNDHIKDVADRFAREGYIALAPDMYTREGNPDPNDIDDVIKIMFSVPDSQAMADLDAAARHIKGQSDSNGKVGAIGFCSGGRYTLMFGCTSKNLDAAVDSAGGFIIQDDHPPTRPVSPIDMVNDLSCPLLGLFGEEDANPSPEHAERRYRDTPRGQEKIYS